MNIVYGFNRIKTWKSNIDIPKADNVNDIAPHTEPAIRSSLSLGQSENPIARYDDLKRREKKKTAQWERSICQVVWFSNDMNGNGNSVSTAENINYHYY